jgi:hypothetical protein
MLVLPVLAYAYMLIYRIMHRDDEEIQQKNKKEGVSSKNT